ncbi:MAG: phospholipase D-like domain-containing protein [Anaerolineae bacterium]|nr:phospholipase D-like domain-containing protein [Anaerolineae bacterium]
MKANPFAAAPRLAALLTFFLFIFVVSACGDVAAPQPTVPPQVATPAAARPTATTPVTAVAEGLPLDQGNVLPWLSVYFTNPDPPDQVNSGVDRQIVPLINAARRRIDAAFFDFNLPSVVNALIGAHRRGVQVRLVLDVQNGSQDVPAARGRDPFDALAALKAAKLPFVDGGRSNGLMHEKLLIIDGAVLFVGSWNASWNDTFRNNNNILRITDQRLIANYQRVFNNMYESQLFGRRRPEGAQTPRLTIDGVAVENYFAPPDGVMARIIAEVRAARRSVRFMTFTFTHPELAAALLERRAAGVSVEGVFENRGASQGAFPTLFCAGARVKVDGNPYTMHHKVFIIDDRTVITGSFNHTRSADTVNDESILIIRSPQVAALYRQEFDRLFRIGRDSDNVTCSVSPEVATPTPNPNECPDLTFTCAQLTSCEQAVACLREGNTRLDRDGNGIPCEALCRPR